MLTILNEERVVAAENGEVIESEVTPLELPLSEVAPLGEDDRLASVLSHGKGVAVAAGGLTDFTSFSARAHGDGIAVDEVL